MAKRLCCCIPDQTKFGERCQKMAEYRIFSEDNPNLDNYTESCGEHLEQMLDGSKVFRIFRIEGGGDDEEAYWKGNHFHKIHEGKEDCVEEVIKN
jgi:hypothetical protein